MRVHNGKIIVYILERKCCEINKDLERGESAREREDKTPFLCSSRKSNGSAPTYFVQQSCICKKKKKPENGCVCVYILQ